MTVSENAESGLRAASRRPATIYDVAQEAGVSHQTVTRFLQGYPGIRPATQSRVERALAELDYRPNLTARSLKSGRSHRIGALTHDLSQVGPSKVAEGASAAARDAGYVLDLVALDVHDPRAIEDSLDMLARGSLAGVLALSNTDEMTRAFESARVRVPFHIHTEIDDQADHMTGLTGFGIPSLIAHLVELGHTDFVHIAGPSNWTAGRNRRRAIESTLAKDGLRLVASLTGDWSARSGHAAIASLRELPRATAYIAANDQMALGAMLALKERGLRIPDDVSVGGIDDIPEAAYFDPPLTTLRVDFASTGRDSVAALLAQIGGAEPFIPENRPALLMRRASTGPAASDPRNERTVR